MTSEESTLTLVEASGKGAVGRVAEIMAGDPRPDVMVVGSAFQTAVREGQREVVRMLVKHAPSVMRSVIGHAPSDEIAAELVRELYAMKPAWGSGHVVFAASLGRTEAVKALLEHGGDPNEVSIVARKTTSALAAAKKFPATVAVLKAAGASAKVSKEKVTAQKEALAKDVAVLQAKMDAKREAVAAKVAAAAEAKAAAAKARKAAAEEKKAERQRQEAAVAEQRGIAYDREQIAAGTMTRELFSKMLRVAVGERQLARLSALIEAGARVDDPYPNESSSPLVHAIRQGSLDAVRILLAGGASPDRVAERSPFEAALSEGHEDIAIALVEAGAQLRERVDSGGAWDTPARALYRRDRAEIHGMKRLCAVLDAKDAPREAESDMDLHLAAILGRVTRLNELLAAGAVPGSYELGGAIRAGQLRIVTLLAAKAAPDVRRDSLTVPASAPWLDDETRVAMVRELLAAGVDLAAPSKTPPLEVAARFRRKAIVELLLANGADPKAPHHRSAVREARGDKEIRTLFEAAGGEDAATRRARLKALAREAFRATFEEGEGPARGTRVGGRPWLADGETWPLDAAGVPYPFILQVDLSALPGGLSKEHGTGLARAFGDGIASVVLVAPPGAKGDLATPPEGVPSTDARHLAGATPLAREIPMTDPESPDWDEIKRGLRTLAVRDGQKLGGWPRRRQDPGGPAASRLVLQLDDHTSEMTFLVQYTKDGSFGCFSVRG